MTAAQPLWCGILLLALLPVLGVRAAEPLADVSFDAVLQVAAAAPEPDARIPWGRRPRQFGELWLPAQSGPHPLVILIHGGCWQNAFDVGHSRALAAALRDTGRAVWSIEYRALGDPGGGWPGTLTDVAAAVDRVTALAPRYDLDLARVVLSGHSAGGHLALWAAARPGFTPAHPFYDPSALAVSGVVALAAITDLSSYAAGTSSCEQAAAAFIDGVIEPDQWGSPTRRPLAGLPVVLVTGAADTIVPAAQAERYVQAAAAGGLSAELVVVPAASHFDMIHPDSVAFGPILAAFEALEDRP